MTLHTVPLLSLMCDLAQRTQAQLQLTDRADVLMREAEVAMAALRAAMKQSSASEAPFSGPSPCVRRRRLAARGRRPD
jgi:hypothetical protein